MQRTLNGQSTVRQMKGKFLEIVNETKKLLHYFRHVQISQKTF